MSEWISHMEPIPDGFQIYEKDCDVAGLGYQKDDARAFLKEAEYQKSWLELERDPDNLHDKNAVKVHGCNENHKRHIGYVPAAIAARIVNGNYLEVVKPRLARTHYYYGVKGDGYEEFTCLIQIIGPKGGRKEEPGVVAGKAIPDHVETIKQLTREKEYLKVLDEYRPLIDQLKAEKDHQKMVDLLEPLIDMIETESRSEGMGVAPWYYEQAANAYKKLGDPDNERAVLERFAKQKHAPGMKPAKLMERLAKILEKK